MTKKQPAATPSKGVNDMRNYHVILTDGSERNVRADLATVDATGSLVFENGTERIMVYAPGTWTMCELERKDDTGE
jgi:hypothetical protein